MATRIADAAGQAQSALSSAAASIQDVEERIPHTFSLGTRQFCIASDHASDCADLPLNLLSLLPDNIHSLPDAVQNVLRERAGQLSSAMDSWIKISALTVPCLLIAGTVLMTSLTIASVCLAFGRLPWVVRRLCRLSFRLRAVATLSLGLFLCTPLIALALILHVVLRSADKLPAWVTVDEGDVGGLCFGVCACALMLAIWTTGRPLTGTRSSRE